MAMSEAARQGGAMEQAILLATIGAGVGLAMWTANVTMQWIVDAIPQRNRG
jgi:hypothetical protein